MYDLLELPLRYHELVKNMTFEHMNLTVIRHQSHRRFRQRTTERPPDETGTRGNRSCFHNPNYMIYTNCSAFHVLPIGFGIQGEKGSKNDMKYSATNCILLKGDSMHDFLKQVNGPILDTPLEKF